MLARVYTPTKASTRLNALHTPCRHTRCTRSHTFAHARTRSYTLVHAIQRLSAVLHKRQDSTARALAHMRS
eukprot:2203467-Pleurochrysis_carterae.AAC.1